MLGETGLGVRHKFCVQDFVLGFEQEIWHGVSGTAWHMALVVMVPFQN